GQVTTGADDGASHGDRVEDGLEDRELDVVVGRQRDEDESPAAAEGAVGLLEGPGRDGGADRGVGASERLDGGGGILDQGIDGVVGTEAAGQFELLVDDVDGDNGCAGDPGVLQRE